MTVIRSGLPGRCCPVSKGGSLHWDMPTSHGCVWLPGNRIVERQRVSQGGVQATVVDHRLVIKRALELLATQIILVHNHPSGAALPSEQDKILTKKIAEAAALFDIRLLDHLIIARGGEYSFRQSGLLQ